MRVRTWRRNGSAFLEVTDNGIGIPEGERERVFQRFYRSETELARRERGVGLGLYLVRSFAEAGGGDVKALPADWGEGTTIRVRLDAAEDA
jgi:two-component system sensor histidine kinase SenX3